LKGGGVNEWIWKGKAEEQAAIGATIFNPGNLQMPLLHSFSFLANQQSFVVGDESIENAAAYKGAKDSYFFYRYQGGDPVLNSAGNQSRKLVRDSIKDDQSILAQRKDPEQFPELYFLSEQYEKIKIYRYWEFGRDAIYRNPQAADLRSDVLEEDFSNLGLFLNHLRKTPKTKRAILEHLQEIYAGIDDFDVSVVGGSVQLYFTEGDFVIPASRLSDGTLRFLCLLAILCDPTPPPVICIEEPELGLHPDVLPKLAELLIEASTRTQLFVTTHSDLIVSNLSDIPDAVLVCEKHDGQTKIERLDHHALKPFLEKYNLGELWIRGDIGGLRW
jgi:predicted ATPase